MKSIEDRLRDAALAAAGTVPDGGAPPLRLPARQPGPGWGPDLHRLRSRLLAVAAPAAAAVAVAGVITAAVVATGHDQGRPPSAAAVAAPRVPPPYLVALRYIGTYKGWKLQRTDAVIARTATGKGLVTIPVPRPYNSFVAVTGSYDDRTFVLAAQKLSRSRFGAASRLTRGSLFPATRLFELRFRVTRGEVASWALTPLTRISLPSASFGQMALSPDGTRLAVTEIWRRPAAALVGLRVYNLVTGAMRSWPLVTPSTEGTGGYPIDVISTPSWAADGRHLALTVSSGRCNDCVRLLDTASQATTVQAASRIIVRPPRIHSKWVDWNTTLLSPDGSRVLRSVTICVPVAKNECYDVAHLYGYSARSGRQLINLSNRVHNVDVGLMWLNPGGTHLVASELAEGNGPPFIKAFRYTPGGFMASEPLPPQTVAAAW